MPDHDHDRDPSDTSTTWSQRVWTCGTYQPDIAEPPPRIAAPCLNCGTMAMMGGACGQCNSQQPPF